MLNQQHTNRALSNCGVAVGLPPPTLPNPRRRPRLAYAGAANYAADIEHL